MKFYRENKVNPFASCLPLVAQLPVFISLFYMLRTDLRQDICPEVNAPDQARRTPLPCGDARSSEVLVHPGPHGQGDRRRAGRPDRPLRRARSWLSTLLMSTTTRPHAAPDLAGAAVPLRDFVIRFPAGLLVYWITTNLWTIGQQTDHPEATRPDCGRRARDETAGGVGGSGVAAPAAPAAAEATRTAPKPSVSGARRPTGGEQPKGRPTAPPAAAPPRKKKKRSGRRR